MLRYQVQMPILDQKSSLELHDVARAVSSDTADVSAMPRVLIVDDDEDTLYYLRTLLAAFGYNVESALHGGEALTKARRSPPSLVIVLLSAIPFFMSLRWMKTTLAERDRMSGTQGL